MQAVRERDGECVVTGFKGQSWVALEAAHVFPLGHAAHWEANNFGRWITDDADGSINSAQNGILLQSTFHQMFDLFIFSINPDVW